MLACPAPQGSCLPELARLRAGNRHQQLGEPVLDTHPYPAISIPHHQQTLKKASQCQRRASEDCAKHRLLSRSIIIHCPCPWSYLPGITSDPVWNPRPLIAALLPPPSTHLPLPHAPSFLLPRPHKQSNLAHFSLVSSARATLRLLLRCLIVDTSLPFYPTPVKLPPIPCHTASPHAKTEVIRSRAALSPGLAQQTVTL